MATKNTQDTETRKQPPRPNLHVLPSASDVDLSANPEQFRDKLDALAKGILVKTAELENRIQALEPQGPELEKKTKTLTGRIAAVKGSVTTLTKRTAALEDSAARGEPRLQGLEEAAAALAAQAEDAGTAAVELAERQAEAREALFDLDRRADAGETRLDGLEGRADALEADTRRLQERSADLDQAVTALDQREARGDRRLNALEAGTRGLEARATEQQGAITALEGRASHSEGRLEGVAARADALEAAHEAGSARSTALEGRAEESERQLELIASRTAALEESARALEGLSRSIEARLEETARELRQTDARQDRDIKGLGDRLDALEPAHEGLREAHNRLSVHTAGLEGRTDTLHRRFKQAAWAAGTVAVLVAAIAVTAHLQTPAVETTASPEMEARVATLDSRVAEQLDALTASQASLGAVEAQIRALDRQLAEQSATAPTVEAEVSAVREEMQGLDTRLDAMTARLGQELEQVKSRILAVPEEPSLGTPVPLGDVRGEAWIAEQAPDHYAIQVGGVYRARDLADMIGRYTAQGVDREALSHFQTVHRGRDWRVLLHGSYTDFDQALAALETLPEAVQAARPYIRTFAGVQEAMGR